MISYLKNLTPLQWFAVTLAVLGVLGGATAQLNDLFGPKLAHTIVTISTLMTSLISAVMVPMSGQGAMLRAVNDMPGVSRIVVNEKANETLATIAVDPRSKVEATPEATQAVEETAKGGGT